MLLSIPILNQVGNNTILVNRVNIENCGHNKFFVVQKCQFNIYSHYLSHIFFFFIKNNLY